MVKNQIIQGDCLEVMRTLPENSVDAVVTDPPYGLSFMGKKWDYDVPSQEIWEECLRVLKPGGYLLAFAGTRTQHRMAVNIEDAGFEIRDMIAWVYGSGFPKSLNIGKAVDKIQGNEREVVGKTQGQGTPVHNGNFKVGEQDITKGNSPWEGWGTALKPALEPITVARKPLSEKTVAENVLKWGTGGINIDGSRIPANWKQERPESWFNSGKSKSGNPTFDGNLKSITDSTVGERLNDAGRFPANFIHDGSPEVLSLFPDTKSSGKYNNQSKPKENMYGMTANTADHQYDDSGSASRFFYCAKASKSERNKGCDELEKKENAGSYQFREDGSLDGKPTDPKSNFHPTVKPIALMEYLIKMVTPKGGIVLDPFAGSGSTLVAAKQNGYQYIGIEMTEEYIPIIEARLK